ncbi:peptide chain release factor 1 [Buchnera aphidicola]|uniref:Peptide chain release factor 1 n=1 Tax=Buchnera aphidicola (Sarucallis kahawaluokalani) TaxID=1241878 RepID=A0A4D6YIV8_9GAMM|nr:peptide chain release factor 1 [Buchnera aphidicola]QCI25924.1 peptide chain release factor 1 [Buchnera aphidicola (Sarucallis kahawaluokalani)]
MKKTIINKLDKLYDQVKKIEILLSSKKIISNQIRFKKLSKKYLKLSNLINYFLRWKKIKKDIQLTKQLLIDPEMFDIAQDELRLLNDQKKSLQNKIKNMLLPDDASNIKSCFIEIRAATGGDEAAIFSGDLFKMYGRYAEFNHWNFKIISSHTGEKGGFKEIIVKVTGSGVCSKLKFESGGHRVQRVPKTESQGRIHTSTCTVAIIPVIKSSREIVINNSDLKIDTFRSSGAGGQHVNTTDSAIRITHIPTGTVVECQDERSQHKNKSKALSILISRIHAHEMEKRNKENSLIRKNLLGTGDRSDRNRTYNFPKNRVTDHRINLSVYRLDDILNGNLDILIDPITQEYNAKLLLKIV